MKIDLRYLSFALTMASTALPLSAQSSAPPGSVIVTLVAGPSPSKGGRTEVLRRASRAPQNVVVVDQNATADDLAAALAMINDLRAQYGDSLASDFRARTESVRFGARWNNTDYRRWLVDQLVRLRQARQAELSGFGLVRSVKITLPAPR